MSNFNAWIENAVIEPGALVNGLAKVTGGVTIPAGFQVLPGQLVQNQADLSVTTKVAPLTLSLEEFEVGVFDVNQNFALGYTSLYNISPNSVRGIGFDPSDMVDPTNPGSVVPIIGGVQKPVPGFKDLALGHSIAKHPGPAAQTCLRGAGTGSDRPASRGRRLSRRHAGSGLIWPSR